MLTGTALQSALELEKQGHQAAEKFGFVSGSDFSQAINDRENVGLYSPFSFGRMLFHSLNLLCARILAIATHRAGVDAPTEQSRRDGTACSPARECRVTYG